MESIPANGRIDWGEYYQSAGGSGRSVIVGLKVSRREIRNALARSIGERGGNRFLPFPCFGCDSSRTVTGRSTPLPPHVFVLPVFCRVPGFERTGTLAYLLPSVDGAVDTEAPKLAIAWQGL